ncbi:SpoIIE family protein phosphatase [Peribacillus sp. RS7]|uniref:SpoIIE family protein phosphatase n=1 Tax=unclassified Peribacillus TaxID=2675266 RepID=UPI00259FE8C3|nr:SpoIIE family protein phosphatase [Peribacillus sp. ACCC06369]MDM5358752.1 SpoIIE family protein phosphatase [Peribacillus sp. ACCC06369]
MNEQLNHAPCGFVTLSKEGILLSINQTLVQLLGYSSEQLVGHHINVILAKSARLFIQLYFFPLVTVQHRIEEMYLSLTNVSGEEIPVLINATLSQDTDNQVITCVVIPMQRRIEYVNQLIISKKLAEDALKETSEANSKLEKALKDLEENQQKLLEVNKQNEKFKRDTHNELKLAKKIQERSLPETISDDHIEIESYYFASRELSGDIYGCYQINKHRYGIILLDVMGHGISSALITMSLQSLFQRLITKGAATNVVIKELDDHLHTLFHNNQDSWHYCTAIYLIIDTDKQTIEYTNSGHPPAIFQNSAGNQLELRATSPPIGTFEGIQFKIETFNYDKGSKILLYTDGVSEPLGFHRLGSLLMEHSSDSLIGLKEKILQSLQNEGEEKFKNDDQCFILIDLK